MGGKVLWFPLCDRHTSFAVSVLVSSAAGGLSQHRRCEVRRGIIWLYQYQSQKVILLAVVQLVSHVQLCNPMDCSMPSFPVLYLPEFAETHVH